MVLKTLFQSPTDREDSGSLSAGITQTRSISRTYKDLQSTVRSSTLCPSLPDLTFPSPLGSPAHTAPPLLATADQYLFVSDQYQSDQYLFGWISWWPAELRKNLPQCRRCLGPSAHMVWRASLPGQCTCVHQVRNSARLGKGEHGSSCQQKARLPTSCYFQTLQQLCLPVTSMKFSRLVRVNKAKCCCRSLLQLFLPFYVLSRQNFHTYVFLDFTQFLSAVLFQTLFLSCAFSAHCFSNDRAVQVSWLVPSLSNRKKSPVRSHDLSTSFSVCRLELITLGQKMFDMLLWSLYPGYGCGSLYPGYVLWLWSPIFLDCANVPTSENTVDGRGALTYHSHSSKCFIIKQMP